MASYKAHKKEEIQKKADAKGGFEKKWKKKDGAEEERDQKRQRKYAEAHRYRMSPGT